MIGIVREVLDKEDDYYIDYHLLNGNTIKLTGNFILREAETIQVNKKIIEIVINDMVLQVNNFISFTFKEVYYCLPIKEIHKNKKGEIIIKTSNNNDSRIFCVPSLGEDCLYYGYGSYFKDSYLIKEDDTQELGKKLYLQYLFVNNEEYLTLEKQLRSHPYFICVYDHHNDDHNTYVLFEFNVPSIYHEDIRKFTRGEYSKFSKDYKNKVYAFFEPTKDKTLLDFITRIFNRDLSLFRELYGDMGVDEAMIHEVYSKCSLVDETI